jgi:hypothetical protein
MHVRASRSLSSEQVGQLEKLIFSGGAPGRDQLDILYLIDAHLRRRDPRWVDLMDRAAHALVPAADSGQSSIAPFAQAA